jgi:hypothetical protein
VIDLRDYQRGRDEIVVGGIEPSTHRLVLFVAWFMYATMTEVSTTITRRNPTC